MTLLVNGDDTMNTIFGYSDDKETSVTSFGDDTLMTYNVIVMIPTIDALCW
jgi:hypothetical protein